MASGREKREVTSWVFSLGWKKGMARRRCVSDVAGLRGRREREGRDEGRTMMELSVMKTTTLEEGRVQKESQRGNEGRRQELGCSRSNQKIISREERVESTQMADDIGIWREPNFFPGFSSLSEREAEPRKSGLKRREFVRLA